MVSMWMGEYPRKTFFYGIEGEDKNYPVAATEAIRQKMDDESINFTGLGEFSSPPTEAQVLERIEEVAKMMRTPSIYDQIPNVDRWLATTDRAFKEGDRVVHIEGGHNGRSPCPARGVLLEENMFWKGSFGLLLDGNAQGAYFYPEMTRIVKEAEFDALGLVAMTPPPSEAVNKFGAGDEVKVINSTCVGKVQDTFFDQEDNHVVAIEWQEDHSYCLKIFGSYVPYDNLELTTPPSQEI